MKFIGQFIQDFIARFRNDVYLEDVSTGTIASGGNLGLDSNNKIVKATVSSGSGDITSVVAGVGLSGGATEGDATLTVDFSEFSGVIPTHGDMLATLDSDGSTEQLTHIRDLAVLLAGSGLTATNSVIAVDTLNQNTTGQAGTVATIAGLAPNTATTQATQPNITSLGTLTNLQVDFINADGSTLTITDSSDTGDLFSINTGTHGATTITTTDDDAHAADLTFQIDGFTKFSGVGGGLGGGVEIENGSNAGNAALTIDNNDVDQHALHIDAANTTSHAVRVDAKTVTTKAGIFLDCDALTTGNALFIDVDDDVTETATKSLIQLDYLKPQTGASQTSTTTGLDINFNGGAGAHGSATVNMTGVDVTLDVINNTGTVTQTGYSATLTDGDVATTVGYFSNVEDGGIDFKAVSSADTGDMFTISTTTHGATTLTTIDDDGTNANLDFAIDGTFSVASTGIDIATDGTITNATWSGTAIATAGIADDAVTFAKASGVSPKVFGSTIKILPSDFMSNDDGGSTKFGIGFVETDGTSFGMKIPNSGTELLAFVSIPEGMKATHVDIFDDSDNRAIEVFEANVNSRTITSKGSGNCNTTLDITDVNATATNYLLILVTTTATSDRTYGGTVTIAAQ